MLRELVSFAERPGAERIPLGYRRMGSIRWILRVTDNGDSILVPTDIDPPRPTINRSSGIEPLLLADSAMYVLGIPKSESASHQKRANKAQEAFWNLLTRAEAETGDPALEGLSSARFEHIEVEGISSDDTILVQREAGQNPLHSSRVQEFWVSYLAEKTRGERPGQCGACGTEGDVLRILPTGIKGFPQDVKLSSVNLDSFESYGFEQSTNSPLCFRCGSLASAALSELMTSPRHRVRLTFDDGGGLQAQYALFWLKEERIETADGQSIDLAAVLQTILTGRASVDDASAHPEASLNDIEGLLRIPWQPRSSNLAVDADAFHMAIVSANVSRLVIRGWFASGLAELQANLRRYLESSRMADAWGGESAPVSLRQLMSAVGATRVDAERNRWDSEPLQGAAVRAILATAYRGTRAPRILTVNAVRVLQKHSVWNIPSLSRLLVVAIKLEQTYRGGTMTSPTETLDPNRNEPAYLCGRLLAVLERAQGIHSSWKLNTTIVERNYGAASTRPLSAMTPLVKLATTAHLSKAGRVVNEDMTSLMAAIDIAGGFPKLLDIDRQADFALGFYQQRAMYRIQAKKEDPQ